MKVFKQWIVAGVVLLCSWHSTQAQQLQPDAEGSLVKWMKLEEALEKVKTQSKPVLIDFYTDWCGWCKRMMQTTYANPGLAQYINTNFYPVKFNAEGKDTINYLGQKYFPTSDAPRTTHPLAAKLLQGKMMYPTTLFMNNFDKAKNDFTFSILANGYLESNKLEPILIFTLENVFRNSEYEDFKVEFDKAFFDTTTEEKLKQLKWKTPKEALHNRETSKKKTLVFIHTDWCNACRVMSRTSFTDTLTRKLIEERFDIVNFNPEITDSITFKGQTFVNARSPQAPFHQLALALSRNNFVLPTLAILDENMNLLDAIPFYLNPKVLKDITTYYGNDVFKTKGWADFIKEQQKN
ncbi:MAG: thioredoxin family protein [Chitinophagales bacterium]|nr:thioredoxin family protein [Chitinophagales bacterium]